MYGLKGHAVHYTYLLHIIIVLNVCRKYLPSIENDGNQRHNIPQGHCWFISIKRA